MTRSPRSSTRVLRAIFAVSIVGLAACTSGASASPSTSAAPSAAASETPASPTASEEPSASAAASESETAQSTAIPTAIDPCQIVTAEEASTLTGVTLGAGQASTDENNVKTCDYGAEGVVFSVIASQAPDEATAKKNEDDAKADLEKNAPGLKYNLEELPGIAPGADAAVVSGSASVGGNAFSGIAIYVLKGTEFFAITDISTGGAKAPTSAQMQDEAKVAIGRLP
jgi:hypothetical protein